MMLKKYLNSEQGMGFVDLLAATIVSIIALSSMFLIILSSQIRVTQNYHYRKALLEALSRMETIKYYNRNFTKKLNLSIPNLYDSVVIDENYHPALMGSVNIDVRNEIGLTDISSDAKRYVLTVKINWQEKTGKLLNIFRPKFQQVVLREDYYYRGNAD